MTVLDPEEEPTIEMDVEVVPEPEEREPEPDAPVLTTPTEIIDHWLDVTRHRNVFASDDVQNLLLDIRNSL